MTHRYLGIFLIAIFLQVPAGDCMGQIGEVIGSLPTSYPASNDPGQKAADGSEKASLTDDQVKSLRELATTKENLNKKPINYGDIDRAIEARPGDAGAKLQKAAMLRLEGKTAEAEALEAAGYTLMATRGNGGAFPNQVYHASYATLLENTVANSPDGPGKTNMKDEMCAQVRAAWRQAYHFKTKVPNQFTFGSSDRFEISGECGKKADYFRSTP